MPGATCFRLSVKVGFRFHARFLHSLRKNPQCPEWELAHEQGWDCPAPWGWFPMGPLGVPTPMAPCLGCIPLLALWKRQCRDWCGLGLRSRVRGSGVTLQRSSETVPLPFHLPTQPVLAVIHYQCYSAACPMLAGTAQAVVLRGLRRRMAAWEPAA